MSQVKDTELRDKFNGQKPDGGFFKYVSAKNEKLSSALYLVSDFLSDSEPIKWRLRENALELIKDINLARADSRMKFGVFETARLISKFEEMISLLEVALTGSSVSQMNFSVLKNEYQSLCDLIEKKAKQSSLYEMVKDEGYLLPEVTRPETVSLSSSFAPKFNTAHTTPTYSNYPRKELSTDSRLVNNYQGQKDSQKDRITDSKKLGRKERIVAFIKGKGWMSINDIAKSVSDCSLKTVQRELSDLVEQGVLKKQGDRRWSRYILS